jgi:drug/metabolite transporter (DMT)-like permease
MAIISVCLASLFLAIANLLMRKSVDAGGTTKTYLSLQLTICFFIAIVLGPVRTNSYSINGPTVCIGLFAGVVLIGLLSCLGKALERGPPGLTFSILSAAAVFPGLVMAIFFGSAHGFYYTPWHAVGSIFVLIGLFWAGRAASDREPQQNPKSRAWLLLVMTMFFLHIMLLLIYQGKGLPPFEQVGSEWFVPMMYLAAVIIQMGVFLKTERRWPFALEWVYGIAGAVCNSLCTFFLLHGAETAEGLENCIIFPIYSIGTIVFSNLWGQRLYGEKINWRACQVCALGIVLGSVDWKVTLSALGF